MAWRDFGSNEYSFQEVGAIDCLRGDTNDKKRWIKCIELKDD